jgi:ApbE superfamily uncharacterized protein (UPF0280 family)
MLDKHLGPVVVTTHADVVAEYKTLRESIENKRSQVKAYLQVVPALKTQAHDLMECNET